ncbi:unnamed protein product [Urochloa humidicola]
MLAASYKPIRLSAPGDGIPHGMRHLACMPCGIPFLGLQRGSPSGTGKSRVLPDTVIPESSRAGRYRRRGAGPASFPRPRVLQRRGEREALARRRRLEMTPNLRPPLQTEQTKPPSRRLLEIEPDLGPPPGEKECGEDEARPAAELVDGEGSAAVP